MSEPTDLVCDLTRVMRTRLLCGLYNQRAVPPRWRRLAQAYCITLAAAFSFYTYFAFKLDLFRFLNWSITLSMYIFCVSISLWTGDEFIYKFFTQNRITDITLDSRVIFNNLENLINKTYITACVVYFILEIGIAAAAWSYLGLVVFAVVIFPETVFKMFLVSALNTKLLIMALFNARLLVLKRRLQRYGFRTVGRRRPPPYCQIYEEILHGLDATDNPLKVMLFFDLIFSCIMIIFHVLSTLYVVHWEEVNIHLFVVAAFLILRFSKFLVVSFGHVALLESAAAHCDDMIVFTVTELIKTPTPEERQRILALLDALESRGARYQVMRALPLNARLVLAVLGFCSAQVTTFVKTVYPVHSTT